MSKQFENFESDLELRLQPITSGPGPMSATSFINDNKSLKGKRLVMIIGSIVVFMLIAYLLTRFLSKEDHITARPDANKHSTGQSYNSVLVDFPEIVTNLAPTNDKESYIKLLITLELTNSKDQDAVDQKLIMLKDSVIVFLRELRATDLTSSGGSVMLKVELIKRINKIIYPAELKDILFKEIFVNQ